MNVLVFASRKGGAGKSSLAAHLATYLADAAHPTLLVDGDPQASLSLWHRVRGKDQLLLKKGIKGLGATLKKAQHDGIDWVLVDTPPNASRAVVEAIRHATMVIIPMRPGLFDIDAVRATVDIARNLRKPYAAVINAAPPKRGTEEAHVVTDARGALKALGIPVWAGQISHRPDLSVSLAFGEGVKEHEAHSQAADEIEHLWRALTRSLEAVRRA